MKRLLSILLCVALLCLTLPALADDLCLISDPASAGSISTEYEYLCIYCPANSGDHVTISVTDPSGSCIYQRDYGTCDSPFYTDDIYLPMDGSEITYAVTLTVGETTYAFDVTREAGYLYDNAACAGGYPLSSITGSRNWCTATIIDVNALEGSSMTVPLCASKWYCIGTATLSVSGGKLTVSASLSDGLDGSIDSATVYVAMNALQAQELGQKYFTGTTSSLDRAIDLSGANYAAVYVQMIVSYDPSTAVEESPSILSGQDELWQRMQNETANEAVG